MKARVMSVLGVLVCVAFVAYALVLTCAPFVGAFR